MRRDWHVYLVAFVALLSVVLGFMLLTAVLIDGLGRP